VVAGAHAGPRCAQAESESLIGPGPPRAPATTQNLRLTRTFLAISLNRHYLSAVWTTRPPVWTGRSASVDR